MRGLVTCVACAAFIGALTPANARGVVRLQPATPWVVDYAENSCRLGRTFGEGKDSVTLVMSQFAPGDSFQLMLTGRRVRVNGDRVEEGRIRFGPKEADSKVSAKVGKASGEIPALLVEGSQRLAPRTETEEAESRAAFNDGRPVEPETIGPAREAAATWLELRRMMSRDLILETGPMDRPLAALRECSWDMIKSWGLDVEQQKKLTRKPRATGGIQSWFNASDYPVAMLRDGYEGIVTVRLLIDAEGNLTSCKMQASTQPKEFDDVVCAAIKKRGTFEPALDEHGRPVPSYWSQTVNFRLRG